MLDNTVAGGISSGMGVMETIIKESMEEASIPEEIARQAKPVGCISYFYMRSEKAGGESGLFQPEVEYIYDLKLGPEVILQPLDGEVEEFYLWDVQRVKEEMALGNFKPNCGVVLIVSQFGHEIIGRIV
jgi:8-oxo-dGTP pyrophosphatase MutT (NUDIX family)